jgi:Uma2 family endonuclease
VTAEELLKLPENHQRNELVKGILRSSPLAGFEHGVIVTTLSVLLDQHVREHRLGVVLGGGTGYHVATDPDTVRGADVSFVAAARLHATRRPVGFWRGAPDLAVEVASPDDTVNEGEQKVDDYLNAGCRMVWVVNPRRRTVTIYRPGAAPAIVGDTQELDGQDVVPGFRCRVSEIFA